ncbi:MAG: putative collagen-binding domain-containing protein [bacterium]
MKKILLLIFQLYVISSVYAQNEVSLEAPSTAPQYGVAEFVFRVQGVTIRNPFTDIEIKGTYVSGNTRFSVDGFADSQDGSLFRLRFSPEIANTTYTYDISFKGSGVTKNFTGKLVSTAPQDKGPVIVDPLRPKHFIYAGTKEPFFHIGCTEYHLLDISNDDSQVEATINYCQQYGFNKIRFLLSGYPRDYDNRTSDDVDHGVPEDPWEAPNYGSLPGKVNPLPTWLGKPHDYDFERFNVIHWQRVDRAVRLLKEKWIIATCIIQIEKQNLPKEIGELTANEYRLYQYAVARLSAFNNVWWDLGNEHNEFRKPAWGNTMGDFVKEKDPYDRLASAHAYADFFYSDSPWADFIITQQYGDVDSVHNWALKYYKVPKPYVNEEYGYEGRTEKPIGHGMNSEWVRKCHWAIAMAGGYGTYGDWSNGVSYFYMGIPGPGKAALHLKYLKSFFESLSYNEMTPSDDLTTNGYCLSKPQELYILYLPEGGSAEINLSNSAKKQLSAKWFDPVTGEWSLKNVLRKGKNLVNAPSEKDWVCLISTGKTKKKK